MKFDQECLFAVPTKLKLNRELMDRLGLKLERTCHIVETPQFREVTIGSHKNMYGNWVRRDPIIHATQILCACLYGFNVHNNTKDAWGKVRLRSNQIIYSNNVMNRLGWIELEHHNNERDNRPLFDFIRTSNINENK